MPWRSDGRAYSCVLAVPKGWYHKNARVIPSASFPCRVNHNITLQHYRLPVVTASVTKRVFDRRIWGKTHWGIRRDEGYT